VVIQQKNIFMRVMSKWSEDGYVHGLQHKDSLTHKEEQCRSNVVVFYSQCHGAPLNINKPQPANNGKHAKII
jgi:hypothetical protein